MVTGELLWKTAPSRRVTSYVTSSTFLGRSFPSAANTSRFPDGRISVSPSMVCQLAATVSADEVVIGSNPLVPSSYEMAARMVPLALAPAPLLAPALARCAGVVPQADSVPVKAAAVPMTPARAKRLRREVVGTGIFVIETP